MKTDFKENREWKGKYVNRFKGEYSMERKICKQISRIIEYVKEDMKTDFKENRVWKGLDM